MKQVTFYKNKQEHYLSIMFTSNANLLTAFQIMMEVWILQVPSYGRGRGMGAGRRPKNPHSLTGASPFTFDDEA